MKDNHSTTVFIAFIVFYGLQLIVTLFIDAVAPWIDLLAVCTILIIFFFLHRRFHFSVTVPLCMGIGFFFHIIGLYRIVPYNDNYLGQLYGWDVLHYHYDWFVHSVGFGLFAFAFMSIMYPYLKKTFKSTLVIFFICLFCMLGLGASNEISEYVGYTIFGYGEGFLEFGAGDYSPSEGPWENASIDLINNLIGGCVSISIFLMLKRRTR